MLNMKFQFYRYAGERRGNFAVFMAISLLAVVMAIGVAIDMSGIRRQKSAYQNYADSAVLFAARTGERDQALLLDEARKNLYSNNKYDNIPEITLALGSDDVVSVTLRGNYDSFIMGIFGQKTVPLAATASSPLALIEPTHIALVLDTTSSMSGNKIDSLKTAVSDLLDIVEQFANADVRISVIPFSQHINIGMNNRNQPWMDVPDDQTSSGNCYMTRDIISMTNCVVSQETCVTDGESQLCHNQTCDYSYGPEYEYCPVVEDKWLGCVGSRQPPWHERPRYGSRKFPGLINIPCGSPVLPLTSNISTVRSTVNSLTPNGETYIPSGLMWGWRTLSPDQPFTQSGYNNSSEKIMILMTDGKNTRSKDQDMHMGTNSQQTNQDTGRICADIKDDDITIYSIAYDLNDTSAKSLVEDCATDRTKYFDVSSALELKNTFKNIGQQLVEVRLSK